MKKPATLFRRIRKVLLIGLVSSGILVLLAVGLLQTQWAQEKILRYVAGIEFPGGIRIVARGPDGTWPFRPQLASLEIFDKTGRWLHATDVDLSWTFRPRTIEIHELHMGTLQLERAPLLSSAPSSGEPFGDPPPTLRLSSLRIDRLELGSELSPHPLHALLKLSGEHGADGTLFQAELTSELGELTVGGSGHAENRMWELACKGHLFQGLTIDLQAKIDPDTQHLTGTLQCDDTFHLIEKVEDAWQQALPLPDLEKSEDLTIALTVDLNRSADGIDGTVQGNSNLGQLNSDLQIRFPLANSTIRGQLQVQHLQAIGNLFRMPLDGSASGQFAYVNEQFQLDLHGKKVRWEEWRIEQLAVKGALQPNLTCVVEGTALKHGQQDVLRSATLLLSHQQDQWNIAAAITSQDEAWQNLKLEAKVSGAPSQMKIAVDKAQVDLAEETLTLQEPFLILWTDSVWQVAPNQWRWRDIPAEFSLLLEPDRLQAKLELPELPLDLLKPISPVQPSGLLHASLQVDGSLQQPALRLNLRGTELTVSSKEHGVHLLFDASAAAGWDETGLQASATVQYGKEDRVELAVRSDATWSLMPLQLPDPSSDLAASLRGVLDLSQLGSLAGTSNIQVAGKLRSGIEFQRKNGELNLKGSVRLDEGSLEHPEWGAVAANQGNDSGMHAQFQLTGTLEHPELRLEFTGKNIELDPGEMGPEFALNAEARLEWTAQGLRANASLLHGQKDRFTMTLQSKETWSLAPLRLPDAQADMTATAEGILHLSLLNSLSAFTEMRVAGELRSGLKLHRANKELTVSGSVQVQDGRFEHFSLGSVFQNTTMEALWEEEGFVLKRLEADTPGRGKIRLTGKIHPSPAGWEGRLDGRFSKARLLHVDAVQAALSGDVSLTKKPGKTPELDGLLRLEETEFHMDRLPPAPAEPLRFRVLGEETADPKQAVAPTTAASSNDTTAIDGAIRLDIPGTLRVEGPNIQSRWEGQLRASFNKSGVMLDGKLSPRRGGVTFFSRSFTLDRTGEILFNGPLGNAPVLDLTATHRRAELEAALHIAGRSTKPTFLLQSDPPMPENEIMARILFGRDMSTITGLQALQVAAAISSMQNNARGDFDVMGQTRDLLGVDQLQIRETGDGSGNPELMAGRQINDRVYLELQQNLREPGTSMLLEVEIGRRISIFSISGTHIRPGVGVSWRKDY